VRLLVVNDDIEMTKTMRSILENQNYTADTVSDGEEALAHAAERPYDGIVLDLTAPKMNGLQVLQKMREKDANVPILLLTSRDDPESCIAGTDAGADDFLPMPFSITEFLARIRAMLRRKGRYVSEEVSFGNISLNCATRELSAPGGYHRLGKREFHLMEQFLRNPKSILSTEELMNRVWGKDSEVEVNVVWTNITFLRRKLKVLGANVEIRSFRNVGYSLVETRAE